MNNTEYNPIEIFTDLDLSETEKQSNIENKNCVFVIDFIFSLITANTTSNFSQLCRLYIRSRSTQTIL